MQEIRPGDKVLMPISMTYKDPVELKQVQDRLAEEFPGVKFVFISSVGGTGSPLVYRPEPPVVKRAHYEAVSPEVAEARAALAKLYREAKYSKVMWGHTA